MKLKGLEYRVMTPRPDRLPPTASVEHRQRGRVVLRHGPDETCDICFASAKRAEQAPPRLSSDNSRSGWADYRPPPLRSEQRFTAWSGRIYRSRSIDDALSMPNDFHEERSKR